MTKTNKTLVNDKLKQFEKIVVSKRKGEGNSIWIVVSKCSDTKKYI